jgi:DNA-binding NarL/FixJ family response regulator
VELVGAVRAAFHGQTAISNLDLRRALPNERAERAREGLAFLTNREHEVLACMSEGLSNRAVALRLGVTENTVRNHVQRILYKLNVHSKLEAIVFSREAELAS